MKKEETIDYLQFTTPEIPDWLGAVPYVGKSPLAFYKACYEFPCGTRVYQGNVASKDYLVQMGGQACEQKSITQAHGRLAEIVRQGGKVSRIDFAVTVTGLDALRAFRMAVSNDLVVSKRFENSQPKIITDRRGNPETVYIGDFKKRGRKGIFRGYNKGLQLGIAEDLTRFELEVRKKQAGVAVRRYTGGVSIGQIIRNVVDLPDCEWWIKIMGNNLEPLGRTHVPEIPDPINKRWTWLLRQVAPALGRLIVIDEHAGTKRWQEFLSAVAASARKYENSYLKE